MELRVHYGTGEQVVDLDGVDVEVANPEELVNVDERAEMGFDAGDDRRDATR